MATIKFSHRYHKMPDDISNTQLLEVFRIHYSELSLDFRVYDTEYLGGSFNLPKTELLVLILVSGGLKEHVWTTIRRWTPEKEQYYKALRGQKVKIIIGSEGNGKQKRLVQDN